MKRIALLTITLILVFTLASCIIIPLHKTFKIDESTVLSIEIYDLCYYTKDGSAFLDTESAVYEIPAEKVADFLSDLAEIRFSDSIIIVPAAIDPCFDYGTWTVRINYIGGSYQLLSNRGYGEIYDSDGELIDTHHYGCDEEEWLAFMKKYVPENFFIHTHVVK